MKEETCMEKLMKKLQTRLGKGFQVKEGAASDDAGDGDRYIEVKDSEKSGAVKLPLYQTHIRYLTHGGNLDLEVEFLVQQYHIRKEVMAA